MNQEPLDLQSDAQSTELSGLDSSLRSGREIALWKYNSPLVEIFSTGRKCRPCGKYVFFTALPRNILLLVCFLAWIRPSISSIDVFSCATELKIVRRVYITVKLMPTCNLEAILESRTVR